MKATGIVRRIDPMGRIVVPKEIRGTLGIKDNDPVEIYVTGDGEVVIKKYHPEHEYVSRLKDLLIDIDGDTEMDPEVKFSVLTGIDEAIKELEGSK